MRTVRKSQWVLAVAGFGLLVGLMIGLPELASAGPTVNGTVTANQGTPGSSSSPWPVSASQSGAWSVGQSGVWQQEMTDGTNVLGTSTNPVRVDPTGTTTQPVSGSVGLSAGSNDVGNVGISGPLPAGTNDIGTVNVATATPVISELECSVVDGDTGCTSGPSNLSKGTVIHTLSVECDLAHGHKAGVEYLAPAEIVIPLSFQYSDSTYDYYSGALTNVDVPAPIPDADEILVSQDYTASSGNGAICTLTYTAG
jgi:hypothetical protein